MLRQPGEISPNARADFGIGGKLVSPSNRSDVH
jgi:hypothetical protein